MTEPVRLELPADVRYVRLAAACVREAMAMALEASAPGVPPDARTAAMHDVELAVHELFMNVAVHAYAGTSGTVNMVLSHDAVMFVAELTDCGQAFDTEAVRLPDLEHGQEHGYGLFMVRALVDELTYRSTGGLNHWRVSKRLRPTDGPGAS